MKRQYELIHLQGTTKAIASVIRVKKGEIEPILNIIISCDMKFGMFQVIGKIFLPKICKGSGQKETQRHFPEFLVISQFFQSCGHP